MKNTLSQFAGQYGEWEPTPALRNYVCCVWVNDLACSRVKDYIVVPDGCVDILWTGESLCVAGPDTRPVLEKVRPEFRVVGIRFYPGAAYRWLRAPLSTILNARVPLSDFWKQDAGKIADRAFAAADPIAVTTVLQQALLDRLAGIVPADPQIAFLRRNAALKRKESEPSGLKQLSHHMGISERTLRRLCQEAFGYGFKTLHRILRFQRLFRLATLSTHPNLVGLAIEAGFADQAHMSREVRCLSSATPAEIVGQLSLKAGRFVQDMRLSPLLT